MFRLIPDARGQRDLDSLARFFNGLALRIGGSEKGQIEEAVIEGFQSNFRNERSGGGGWVALAPSTQRYRVWRGFAAAHPILFRRGDYYDSLVDPGDGEHFSQSYQSANSFALEVGSESELFPWHEGGTPNMPQRSVTNLTRASEREIGDVVTRLLHRLMGREQL